MLTILLLLFSVSGCSGGNSAKDDTNTPPKDEEKSPEQKNEEKATLTKDDLTDSDISPVAISITNYMEVKGVSYEMLEPVMDNISEQNMMAPLSMLGLLMVDLTLLPLSLIASAVPQGNNVWEGPLFLMDGNRSC